MRSWWNIRMSIYFNYIIALSLLLSIPHSLFDLLQLRDLYRPHNDRLFRFLGYRIPEWEETEGGTVGTPAAVVTA